MHFGITVDRDHCKIHPSHFCHNCYLKMRKRTTLEGDSVDFGNSATTVPVEWLPHNTINCQVCLDSQHIGGRPLRKGKHPGRPNETDKSKKDLLEQAIQMAISIAPESMLPSNSDKLRASFILPQPNAVRPSDVTCSTCQCILDRPLILKCQHIICLDCCIKHFKEMRPTCSTCQLHLAVDDIKCPLLMALHALESVRITCPGRCRCPIAYGDMKTHDCTMRNTDHTSITLADVCNMRIDKTPCEQVIRVKKLVGLPPPALELLASSSVSKRILCACTHTHTTH